MSYVSKILIKIYTHKIAQRYLVIVRMWKTYFLSVSAKLIEGCYPDNQRRKENLPSESVDADLPTGSLPTSSNEGASLTPAQRCKRKLETGFRMRCQSATQWPVLGTTDTSACHRMPTPLVSCSPAKSGYYVLHPWARESLLSQICNYSLWSKPWDSGN